MCFVLPEYCGCGSFPLLAEDRWHDPVCLRPDEIISIWGDYGAGFYYLDSAWHAIHGKAPDLGTKLGGPITPFAGGVCNSNADCHADAYCRCIAGHDDRSLAPSGVCFKDAGRRAKDDARRECRLPSSAAAE